MSVTLEVHSHQAKVNFFFDALDVNGIRNQQYLSTYDVAFTFAWYGRYTGNTKNPTIRRRFRVRLVWLDH